MSFLDRDIADLVAPIPEDVLEGKTGREKVETEKGYRAYVRLKNQEEHLSEQAYLKTAKAEQYIPRPPRRVPAVQSTQPVRINIPGVLKGMKSKTGSTNSSNQRIAQRLTRGYEGGKASPKSNQDTITLNETSETEVNNNTKSTLLTATSSSSKRKEIPNKAKSPTESIACLYTPSANIRSQTRNDKIACPSFTKSYRNTVPPPLPGPDMSLDCKGMKGIDPLESHFLPLEEFDNSELEPCNPEDWIIMGRVDGCEGTPATSRYYNQNTNTEGEWKSCKVLDYNTEEDTYFVDWGNDGKRKWVKRLNLIFDSEDKDQWNERYNQACRLRDQAEAQTRLHLFVTGMPDEWITPINEEQVDRILSLVASEFQ